MTLESGYSSRLKRACDYIERGELDMARMVLAPEGSISNLKTLESGNEVPAAMMEANKKIAEQEINILFAEIDRLKLDTENNERFKEIEKYYETIEYFQEKLGLELTVLFDYASFLAKQKKYNTATEKCLKELDRCRKLAKNNPEAHLPDVAWTLNNLAYLQSNTNKHSEAEANYTEALTIWKELAETNPGVYLSEYMRTYNSRGIIYYEQKQYDRAIADFSDAIRLKPNEAFLFHNRGDACHEQGRYFMAIEDFSEAIRLDGDDSSFYHGRGSVCIDFGLYDFAIEDYSEAIRLSPDKPSYYNIRGNLYYRQNQNDLAIEDYTRSIELKADAIVYYNRGNTYQEKGENNPAIADLSEAIRLDPLYARAYSARGKAYQNIGQDNLAAKDFDEAARLKPDKKRKTDVLSQNDIDALLTDINAGDNKTAKPETAVTGKNGKAKITRDDVERLLAAINMPITSAADKPFIPVSIVISEKCFPLNILKELGAGSILEFDKSIYAPIDIHAGNIIAAHGDVCVLDENFVVRVNDTEPIGKTIKDTNQSGMEQDISISVVIGKRYDTPENLLNWGEGTVLELEKTKDKDMDIYAEGKIVAHGEVIVIDDKFGIKITEMVKHDF